MSDFFRRIRIVSWPIWVKLLAGLVLAALIPIALVLTLTVSTVQQVGSQNVQLFIAESSARQAQTLSTAFSRILAEVNDYIQNDTNFARMRAVLPTSSTTFVDPNAQFVLATELQNQLVNVTDPLYDEINLVNADGQLIIQAKADGVVIGGVNMADSEAYHRGVEAQLLGQGQSLSFDVEANNRPVLDVVHVLQVTVPGVRNQVVIGYLIARAKPQSVIFDNLSVASDVLEMSSRLVTRQGFEIDPQGARELDTLNVDAALFDAASSGRPQVERFIRSGAAYVRYYTDVEDSPFVLITEGVVNSVSNQMINFLVERGFALILGIIALIAVLVLLANQLLAPPLRRISQVIQGIARGNYQMPLPDAQRGDEIGELAGSVADMRKQVLDIVNDLERRIEARARDMSATREISHTAATQRDVQQLMDQVVNLIIERFPNIYHAQVFLLDRDERYAVLRASTGDAGRELLARGHRLAVSSISVVGRATATGEMIIARNTDTSRVHQRNELLPETLAELAIPLRVGNRIIGALDVQSRQSDTFDPEQQDVLQTMADQVAVAIENARLYAESLRQLEELERNQRVSTLQAWHEYMNSVRRPHLESAAGVVRSQKSEHDTIRQAALSRSEVVVGEVSPHHTVPVAVPIRLRGQLLGVVEWEVPEAEFDQNKLQLAQDLTDRLAVNLENARLFQESQRAIRREQVVNEISTQLTAQNDIDQILQTAVREVGRALRAPQVSIHLKREPETNGHSNGNGHTGESR
ncbi:MAG: GAF domain-containing protein [Anaerolineae bacterium]|nr:GAF domain-containing protein [Anaerolineae bacterium]